MVGRSEYIEEAYRELERMSADERARLEYEARQKAIRDHEAIMSSAWNRGLQEGREQGVAQGRLSIVRRMLEGGASPEEIMRLAGVTEEEVEKARNL
ncbi:hypothetical protein [Mordavella massiliensis]|uniref:Transposase n=1 Tax=Mordavella massiliensis TaxID=1871024 RepID=A0A938XBJ7_9CLOT|nr:hypothetical protein [Mordavella massiliensis]MBM6947147.1 hypothetical protein [Mordavella massiliensis]